MVAPNAAFSFMILSTWLMSRSISPLYFRVWILAW
jgi:hypothetical protein